MTDFTREIRRRHTSIDRWSGFDRFWLDFNQSLELQKFVASVVEDKTDVASAREHIRRNYVLPVREVQDLLRQAEELQKNSTPQLYRLMEVLYAAAVASCDLSQRNRISMSFAESGARAGKWERARQALTDTMEGLQIFRRFFIDEEHLIAKIEEDVKEGWETEKPHLESPVDIFEPGSENPSREWIDLILWNSDTRPDNGLVAQCDATIRLGIRFEDWLNRKQQKLKPIIMEMSEVCKAPAGTDPIHPARCLVTVADALMEVRQWSLAAEMHQEVRKAVAVRNPLAVHAEIQSAYCHLETGNLELCDKTLQDFDRSLLEKMADSDRIAAGELARFHSVNRQYKERSGHPFPPNAPQKIQDLLHQASRLVNWRQGSENRMAHLNNLYYSMLVRDIVFHPRRQLN